MLKLILSVALLATLSISLAVPSIADSDETVNATVTPLLISLTVSPDTVSYGTRQFGVEGILPSPTSFLATNNGSVVEDFLIQGAASTPGNWVLGSTAAANTYVHRFGTSSPNTALTTSPQPLFADIAIAGNIPVFLSLDMPTSSGSLVTQTLPVTVLAIQSPP